MTATAYMRCGHPHTTANTFTPAAGATTRCRTCQDARRRRAVARSRARTARAPSGDAAG